MLRLPAHFTGFGSKSDGSAGLRFATQELTSDEFAELKRALNSFGWLVFATQDEEVELPTERITDDTKKPSVRLRAVLYLLWKQNGEQGDFDAYYRGRIELIINQIKDKLK